MNKVPYKCHVFVCINDRKGSRKSCADANSREIRSVLKKTIKEKGWPSEDVRVSQSLCLGLCDHGPNVLIYPQNICYSHVTLNDINMIVDKVESFLEI